MSPCDVTRKTPMKGFKETKLIFHSVTRRLLLFYRELCTRCKLRTLESASRVAQALFPSYIAKSSDGPWIPA